MKKSLFLMSVFMLLTLMLSACTIDMVNGSGHLTTDTRKVSGFDSVLFSAIGDVTIIQGPTESLTIEAEDNILPKIITEVRGAQLYIGFDRQNWQDIVRPTKGIKFTLAVKSLNSLEMSGVGSLTADSLAADKLTVKVGGAGAVKITNFSGSSLSAIMSGAGNVEFSGKVNSLDATMSGVGNFACGDLQTQSAKVNLTGAGGATVWASSRLDVSITGAGSVSYYGKPKITKNVTGVGVLNELGAK
ncbi:MAG TPA: head GIN domain-containing protein [Anaerolineaceae bacterium]